MNRLAARLAGLQPFHVMDVLARARALEAQGRSIVHLEIGEPDFATPEPVVRAGIESLRSGHTHYLPALGLPALRAAIARRYPATCRPDPARVLVTPGASGALMLACAALINPGDQVLLADPGYPCNRQFVRLFGGEAVAVPVDAATGYQLTAAQVREHWTPRTAAVLLASPSNPTGTLIAADELERIIRTVEELGGVVIADEIYHGLTYGVEAATVLAYSGRVYVVNSFSKYYGMTGWRLGWLVAPEDHVRVLDKLVQNVFIAASTPAQYAALAAFEPPVTEELERRRGVFGARRDYLLPALRALGFGIPITPQGAFYLYADCSRFTDDSRAFARTLLEQAGVAVTPGIDFGAHRPERYVRFSYANTIENLQEGVRRIAEYVNALG